MENDTGAVITSVETSDADGDTVTVTVDDDRFEVSDGNLTLKENASLDYEAETSVEVTITASDGEDSATAKVYRNYGDGTFNDVTEGSGLEAINARYTLSSAFGDYDLDGDLDLFLAHWGTPRDKLEQPWPRTTENLWRNDTGGVINFTDVSLSAGIAETVIDDDPQESFAVGGHDYTFSPTFARITGDRYPDLVISSDFRTSRHYVNNGDGTFRDATNREVIIDRNGMGSAVGDYAGDGDLDWFVSSIWTDPDGDGKQQFTVGNRLYRNDDGVFSDATDDAGVHDGSWGWGSCFADFDNAGDVDIFQMHRNESNVGTLWRNDTSVNNHLRVKLNGRAPNTAAAGARIKLTANGENQMREILIGSNFASQNPLTQVFGLGNSTQADITVEWPDGQTTTMNNVAANQLLAIDHPDR